MSRTAIIAGTGALAAEVAAALDDPIVAALEGFAPEGLAPGPPASDGPASDGPASDDLASDGRTGDGRTGDGRTGDGRTGHGLTGDGRTRDGRTPDGLTSNGRAFETFRLERLVPFLDGLQDRGVSRVVFAGAIRRPRLDPEAFDPMTASLVPRIAMAMRQGDDAALRAVIAIFEESGLQVAGLAEVAPDLLPGPGILTGKPTATDRADIARATEVVAALGGLDIGQGAVVSGGLTLAVETLPGTAAMLDFAARTRGGYRGGVLWKAPKPQQDRRIDLPTIGPDTVAQAAAAQLNGIAWPAGEAIVIDRSATIAAAEAAGLFLWSRAPDG